MKQKTRKKRDTYEIVMNMIRAKGISHVRKIVYGSDVHEGVAIANFINSRMFGDEIVEKLKS